MMKFTSVEEAFRWWIDNIYKSLPPEEKKGKYTTAWRDYTHNLGIAEKRMKQILSEFGVVDVKTQVNYSPTIKK
jgi:hypothetical protein